jgi:hypothetical protein
MGTELIMGMEEVINYLKELEAKNRKLEEEKKELQSQLDISREVRFSVSEMRQELQEKFDDKEHWGNTMVAYMDHGDHWCHFDDWFRENIDEDDKKQEWVKIWMENTEYEDSDEEESDDEESEEEVLQDINGKNVKIPTEEELKVLGVSREEFIMLAKKSDCAY